MQGDLPPCVAGRFLLPPKLDRRGRRPLIPRVLFLHEAAAILRLTRKNILRMVQTGTLHAFRTGPGRRGVWCTTDLAVMAFMGFASPGFPIPARPLRGPAQTFNNTRPQDGPRAADNVRHLREIGRKGAQKKREARQAREAVTRYR